MTYCLDCPVLRQYPPRSCVFDFLVLSRNIEKLAFMPYNSRLSRSNHFYIVSCIIPRKNTSLKGRGIIKRSAVNYNRKEALIYG